MKEDEKREYARIKLNEYSDALTEKGFSISEIWASLGSSYAYLGHHLGLSVDDIILQLEVYYKNVKRG